MRRSVKRPRRYIAPRLIAIGKPILRYSTPRDAYVLRVVGRKWGPVLRSDRRRRRSLEHAPATDRRRGYYTRATDRRAPA